MTYSYKDWLSGMVPPKGWDAADAVEDGWTKDDVNAFIEEALCDELPYTEWIEEPPTSNRIEPIDMLKECNPAAWVHYPQSWTVEDDGSKVLLDTTLAAIAKKLPSGEIELVASYASIAIKRQHWIYQSEDAPARSAETRRKILNLVLRTGIGPELERRRQLVMKRGRSLPRCRQRAQTSTISGGTN